MLVDWARVEYTKASRYLLAACLAGAAACCVSAAPTWANGPTRTHEPIRPLRIPRSVCGFPVPIRTVANRAVAKTFPDGHVLITGQLKQSMTNLRTGRRILFSVSGPALIWTTPDGRFALLSRGTGWIAQFGGAVHGFLLETHGQVVLNDTSFGVVHGTSRSICPMLR